MDRSAVDDYRRRVRGSLLGGAVGDALGAPVEFSSLAEIRRAHGPDGLRELGGGIGAFGAEVRAGMSEREDELTAMVARRTGDHVPTFREALAEPPAARRTARARGAGA